MLICRKFTQTRLSRCFSRLSNKELEQYHLNGFALPNYQLSKEKLLEAQQALQELLDQNPNISPELLVNSHLEDNSSVNSEGVKGSGYFLDLAASKEIVDIVSQCLGTHNVILWACQIFCKPPLVGKSVPFHQDGPYWPIKPLNAVSAWIALDDSDMSNGGLQAIPQSHTWGMLDHKQIIDDDACISYIADPVVVSKYLTNAVPITLKAGQMSVHDSLLLHGSDMNKSPHRRAGIAVTFMAGESHFDRHTPTEGAIKGGIKLDFGNRPLFVVRGVNANEKNELVLEK